MPPYDWPDEFALGLYDLGARLEAILKRFSAAGAGLSGDHTVLDDVIANNFEEARTWIPIGPTILRKGQASGSPLVSGRVRSIHVSPNGQRVYAGAANGGVWYSSDTGQTWAPIGAGGLAPNAERSDISLTVGDLCIVFGETGGNDDPAKDIVYVGTGEASPWSNNIPGAKYGGVGVLRLDGTLQQALADPRGNPWKREARNLSTAGIFRIVHGVQAGEVPQANGAGRLFAATSKGLYTRSGVFVEDADWTAVQVGPSAFGPGNYCSDVVCTTSGVWATVVGMSAAADGVYFSTTGNSGTFSRINGVSPKPGQRTSIAAVPGQPDRIYVLGKVAPPASGNDHAKVWMVDRAPNPDKVRIVGNIPASLFCSGVYREGADLICHGGDQGNYDQAITVRRSGSNDIVTIGGSLKWGTDWDASLFELTIDPSPNAVNSDFRNQRVPQDDATFRGRGIHPDVHCLTYSGNKLWVGCDGGVFLRDGATVSSLNAGLATVEPGYLDSHPTLDGPIMAGTQDNGTIRRVGDTVWELFRKGDGGGCLYHPTKPTQNVAQYTRGSWNFEPASMWGSGPLSRWNVGSGPSEKENKISSFYSAAACAPGADSNRARLFIGTNRIWYSDTWADRVGGPDWVTIPTGNDPLPWPRGDTLQDALTTGAGADDTVIAIEILQNGALAHPHSGQAILILCNSSIRIFRFQPPAPGQPPVWTTLSASITTTPSSCAMCWPDSSTNIQPDAALNTLPFGPRWTDIAVQDNSTPGGEAFYVTTTGVNTQQPDGSFIPNPAHDTLWYYDGNNNWWRTKLATTGLNSINNTGGSAAAAHSVVVHPTDNTVVYVGNEIGVWEGKLSFRQVGGVRTPEWVWKPAMEGLPQALVQDLSIYQSGSSLYLRAALVSRGVWERDISAAPDSVGKTYIRTVALDTGRQTLPERVEDPRNGNELTFQASPDIAILRSGTAPWGARSPHEAELMAAAEGMTGALSRANHDIFVMVHHRHTVPVARNDVMIDLFLDKGSAGGRLEAYTMTTPIRTYITGKVGGGNPAAPGTLSHIGRIHPDFDVDARNPRAGKLTFNFNYANGSGQGLIIAVVTSPNNALDVAPLNEANLRDVVRKSSQIAVCRFRRN